MAIGEVLWDELPDGPELGGAPLNIAVHLTRLGRPSAILTSVGADDPGRRARERIQELGVGDAWIQTSRDRPTGRARFVLVQGSPRFEILRPAAYDDLIEDSQTLLEIVRASPTAVVIGTLAQQSPQVRAMTALVLESCPNAVRFYDVNLRDGWDANLVDDLIRTATVIKLNETEVVEIARRYGLSAQDPRVLLGDLALQTGARAVCMTGGVRGAALVLDGDFVEGRPPHVAPIDSVGAADAFAAALLDGILTRQDPTWILRRALALGALVASRRGATPSWEQSELDVLENATPIPTRSRRRGIVPTGAVVEGRGPASS